MKVQLTFLKVVTNQGLEQCQCDILCRSDDDQDIMFYYMVMLYVYSITIKQDGSGFFLYGIVHWNSFMRSIDGGRKTFILVP